MRNLKAAALLAALAASLTLPGCFGLPVVSDVVDQAESLASSAQDAADALSSIDFTKESRLVVKDAATGEVLRELTDQAEIEQAISTLSGANGLAGTPDAPAEYVLELWQPETVKLGRGEGSTDEVKVLELTTYQGSSVVTLEVSPIGLSLNLDAAEGAADSLRALAG